MHWSKKCRVVIICRIRYDVTTLCLRWRQPCPFTRIRAAQINTTRILKLFCACHNSSESTLYHATPHWMTVIYASSSPLPVTLYYHHTIPSHVVEALTLLRVVASLCHSQCNVTSFSPRSIYVWYILIAATSICASQREHYQCANLRNIIPRSILWYYNSESTEFCWSSAT